MIISTSEWNGPRGRGRRTLAALLAVGTLVAGCGSGDEPGSVDGAATDPSTDTVAASDLPEEVAQAAAYAEENDLLFVTSKEEIVARAMEIGTADILVSLDDFAAIEDGFQAAYPDLEVDVGALSGTDEYQRFLLEAEAGAAEDYDVASSQVETYAEITQLLAPYDIWGMAEAGILDIPLEMIDEDLRYTVGVSSQIGALAYNRDRLAEGDVPSTWEELLDPKFAGDFILDIRPTNLSPMPVCWGEEETYEFAEKLAAQEPQWVRGQTDSLTRISIGEAQMMGFVNYHSGVRITEDDPEGALEMVLVEPIPVRTSEMMGVFNEDIANNPYAALLFLEWMAGDEAQMILDADPLKSSIHANVGRLAELVQGREVCEVGVTDFDKLGEWSEGIVEAYGFPTAE